MLHFTIEIIEKLDDIINNMYIGTKIPLYPDFYDFIKSDLKHFKAKSFLLKENGNPIGHVLVYSIDETTLYFGYFSVLNDKDEKINFLIKKLINYAIENKFKIIKGPINIPTIIYGWGFMQEGSLDSLFIGKPINSPNYINLFLENKFSIDLKELALEGTFPNFSKIIKNYDFSDYEFFFIQNWDEIMDLKDIFLEINAKNLAPESIITPDNLNVIDNYLSFVKKYGEYFMFNFVKYKKTNEIIACMAGVPNPFRKDENGNYNSFSFFTIAVDKKHRSKGLGWLICNNVFDEAYKRGYNYFSSPVESRQKVINLMAKKVSRYSLRTHIILTYKI